MLSTQRTSIFGFCGLLAGSLLVSLDAVALSPSLPIIEDDLEATTIEVYWASVAYTIGAATFAPIFPATSNATGRRPVNAACLLLFLVGTIVCGAAPNASSLLTGRVFQGIGGGGILSMCYVAVTDLFEMRKRPIALGINSLVWLLGLSIGPIMGGGFSEGVSWRWIFWIVLPINAVALLAVAIFHTQPEKKEGFQLSRLSWNTMDYVGAGLAVASLTSFLIPITWAGNMYAWDHWRTLVPLILGVVGLAGLAIYEASIPANPLLPVKILRDPTVAISFVMAVSIGFLQFGLIFYLPLYYQVVQGYSALVSGIALLPEAITSSAIGPVVGAIISKTGKYKYSIFTGWLIMALGCGILYLMDEATSVAQWVFLNIPAGLGIGIVTPATITSAQAPVDKSKVAVAAGLTAFARAMGQAIGVAACNAIVSNQLRTGLEGAASEKLRDSASDVAKNYASLDLLLALFDGNGAIREELVRLYVEALRAVWWSLFAVSCCCLISTIFIKDVNMDRAEANDDTEEAEVAKADSQPVKNDDSSKAEVSN